ncbi:MAG: hypothetical protein QOK05_2592 [Chloroflexota bacterium]|jgi:hypothetical protein|nr:hypothetical protein [Chloroflexota bacterium]
MPLTKLAAGVFGAVYLLVGIVGFFVTGLSSTGTLIIFPISPLHNVVHLAIGAAGLAAYAAGPAMARTFCQVVGGVLALVAVLGIVVSNPLGILPIGGFDVVLHVATALVLLYLGFAAREEYATA